jgi:hypothetical protein
MVENPLGLTMFLSSVISFSLGPLKYPPVETREGKAVSLGRGQENGSGLLGSNNKRP